MIPGGAIESHTRHTFELRGRLIEARRPLNAGAALFFSDCPEFRPPKIKSTTSARKCATIVIILSARSRCAQEKWGRSEASSSTSRTKKRPGAGLRVTGNPSQRRDLDNRDTAPATRRSSGCERALPRSGEWQPWFDAATQTRNRARLPPCCAPGRGFVRFFDRRDFVLFSMSNFRSEPFCSGTPSTA